MRKLRFISRAVRSVMAPVVAGALVSATMLSSQAAYAGLPDESIRDQIIYFVMPDRFNNGNPENDYGSKSPEDDVLVHGHDKTDDSKQKHWPVKRASWRTTSPRHGSLVRHSHPSR